MEIVIFTLALCGLIIAGLQFSYKNSQRINELEDKQDKLRKDINALYMKPLTNPPSKTKKKISNKPKENWLERLPDMDIDKPTKSKRKTPNKKPKTKKPVAKKSSHQRKSSTKKQILKG